MTLLPMCATLSGIVTVCRLPHIEKTSPPVEVTPSGISTRFRKSQSLKTSSLSFTTRSLPHHLHRNR